MTSALWSSAKSKPKITHSRSSSSSAISTPSNSSPLASPLPLDMPLSDGSVTELSDGLARTKLNGTLKKSDKKRIAMARKQSSPMMPAFIVSAPGKVIAFGEHAVVHGKVIHLIY